MHCRLSQGYQIMPKHQQTQQSKELKHDFQKQVIPRIHTLISNSIAIIQHAKINPKSLTHVDVLQLQHTIEYRAVDRLPSEIGLIPLTAKQTPQSNDKRHQRKNLLKVK